MESELVSSITRRSTPKPRPPVGGKMALSGHQRPYSAVPQGFSGFFEDAGDALRFLSSRSWPRIMGQEIEASRSLGRPENRGAYIRIAVSFDVN